jgi:hypothetical protein
MTDANGEFTVTTSGRPGAIIGDHKVGITKMTEGAAATNIENPTPDDMKKMQMGGGAAASPPKSEIPERYANPENSGLTATVSSDASQNEFEFPLVD